MGSVTIKKDRKPYKKHLLILPRQINDPDLQARNIKEHEYKFY